MRKPIEFASHPLSFADAQEVRSLRAFCKHVVDGDTIDVFVDLGFLNYAYLTIRLRDFDAPEVVGKDRARGKKVTERVRELVENQHVLIRSFKDASTFGRFVADVWFFEVSDAGRVNMILLSTVLKNEKLEK